MLTSVSAADVNNNTVQLENKVIHVSNGSHIETNTTLKNNNTQSSITKKAQTTTTKKQTRTKQLKQNSTNGYIYVNSKGTGDGTDSTTPTDITTALKKVTNGGTIYLVTDNDNDTYYSKSSLCINKTNIADNVTSFSIIGQPDKTIIFKGKPSITISSGYHINILGITFEKGLYKYCGAILNNGDLTVINSTFIQNKAGTDNGGAILNNGNLTVINSTFMKNRAENNGGAISNKGNLIIINSTFIQNRAGTNNGGAIYIEGSATTQIINSTFIKNHSVNDGGAIYALSNLIAINNTFVENNNAEGYGGAIYLSYSKFNSTIENNIFKDNYVDNIGGAIYSSKSNITLNNNTFMGNSATNCGGALFSDMSNVTLINNNFTDNSASYGGAIELTHRYNSGYTYYSINNITNNTFTNNKATYGGAVYSFGTDDTLNNNLFINNTATGKGGAILNSIGNQTIKNNDFTNNDAEQGGAICTVSANLNITNNTFTNNTAKDNSNSIYANYTTMTLSNNTLLNNTTIIQGSIEEYNNRTVYNTRDVVPVNTTEKKYTRGNMSSESSTIVHAVSDGQPIQFSDNSTCFCVQPNSMIPVYHAVYERETITNQTILNRRMNKNVIEYVKAALVLFWNDSEVFEDPSDLSTNRVVIEFFTSYNIHDRTTLAYTPKGLKKPLQYILDAVETRLNQGNIPNKGLLGDNKTTYHLYYYKALDAYNGGLHYQDMLGINLNETPLKISWAWKLVNETTTENVTENYTVNVTKTVPYNTTEEYLENVTVQEPYNTTENYTVNVTKTIPYNTTENYTVNVTKTIPYNTTENYTVNVTKTIPYNTTENYTVNVTKTIPYNTTETHKVNVTKQVQYNTTHKNTQHKTIKPYTIIKTKGIGKNTKINNNHVIKTKPNTKTVVRRGNITIQEPRTRTVTKYRNVTIQEPRTRTVTKYRNVTIQEPRTRTVTKYRNVTIQEPRTRTVTKYRNVTIQEPRTRLVTKYRNVTKTVTKTRLVTKYHEITYQEQRSKTVTKTSYHYKRYIYLLYLEGKISYKDLVAIIGAENIQFDENGNIVIDSDNLDNIPTNITVTGLDNDAIPTTSDNVDTSNPDGLGEQVIDAGIITTEI